VTLSRRRIAAIAVKELRDYRSNRFVILTMAFVPVLFIILPIVQMLTAPALAPTAQLNARVGISMLYMLMIPTIVPSTLAAYSVVGEREQGTLEPVLITPIRREEFLIGKAVAVGAPTLVIAYAVFGIFLVVTALFAQAALISAVFTGSRVLIQLLFTPLLAGWSIWVGIAISARSTDIRVAQQLSALASLPPLAVIALMDFNVVTPSARLTFGLAALLLAVDGLGWRAVARLFNRERLITGIRT